MTNTLTLYLTSSSTASGVPSLTISLEKSGLFLYSYFHDDYDRFAVLTVFFRVTILCVLPLSSESPCSVKTRSISGITQKQSLFSPSGKYPFFIIFFCILVKVSLTECTWAFMLLPCLWTL